ncbi:hypothetical protein A2662_04510 [Candidatus Giovannonibacteria bacterium RIFCSPHIGHO2_01_FULL_45_33]|uniref:Uncharacterized protein n=1 Tax=Candidatus Giovannonibacteria bacterium RIFCSPLOWO2_01_FULL_45_34 TaxID=1798351 RepID=A0A1F5WY95_9BACT|nr:MAG: hypothetical protein A2662_04510 [Candidatus Giovannonibacteria bacterium RIFCSPHIGHO2_01_FULL_45_33]OGF69172.1 MAG: hypothetical protein A3C73_03725 [Candidatus Giovannonibacteria bacterium RIFCSPHIGHO2_02_FULL_44_11]OGF80622.1 MAG: hypothetical protein A2930_02985 [Candidatus Giovannonibacteria bacterium RIFCSPLOWO2_01_FULL_45_34]
MGGNNGNRKRVLSDPRIRGIGVLAFFNERPFGRNHGVGFIHRHDMHCPLDPDDCMQDEHFVRLTIFETQELEFIPEAGDEMEYVAIPYHKGDMAVAERVRFPRQYGKKGSSEEVHARYRS